MFEEGPVRGYLWWACVIFVSGYRVQVEWYVVVSVAGGRARVRLSESPRKGCTTVLRFSVNVCWREGRGEAVARS